jgi:hypothetical protein
MVGAKLDRCMRNDPNANLTAAHSGGSALPRTSGPAGGYGLGAGGSYFEMLTVQLSPSRALAV